jgi:hypothetical protein
VMARGGGWWGEMLEKLLGWGLVGAVALAGAAAIGVALFYLCRYLLSRTGRSRPEPRRRRWLFRLRPRPSRRAAARTATDFYVRLLGWARRTGLPRAAAETASELGARLQGRFPPLAAAITAIVKAYNEEAYREVAPGPAGPADLGAAWRELRRVAHWPARLHAWWTASAELGQVTLPIPANRPRSHPT